MAVAALAISGVLLSLSALFSSLFVYTATVLSKYSPVYSPVRCVAIASEMGDMEMDDNFVNMTGASVKSCYNPNPYPMTLVQANPEAAGEVFVRQEGGELKSIGKSSIPEIVFEPHGQANLSAVLELSMPLMDAFELMSAETLALIAEFRVRAKAEMQYLSVTLEEAEEEVQVCGFEVNVMTQVVGNAACASSMEELVIPSFNDTAVGEDLMEMSEEQYSRETKRKDLGFGGLMAAYLVLASFTGVCGGLILVRRLRGGAREPMMKMGHGADAEANSAPDAGSDEANQKAEV